ncbi:MAG: 23S rRNA (adenine(2503)-C(2))-methyltransferase RlmN [Planctomycetota bacterium]|nr:23S rRNA (adenine(2503)-C(2))-methyltransferase RlmN [Planctomycetota bacterium]
MPDRPHFFDLTPDSLAELLGGLGMPRFRADQLLEWVYRKQVADPALMTNLGKADRAAIGSAIHFARGRVVARQVATDGVQKLLVDWAEPPDPQVGDDAPPTSPDAMSLPLLKAGNGGGEIDYGDSRTQTECVMIPADGRKTACISSQIGCPVGCRFCASGLGGLDGNLSAGQIVEQVWRLGTMPDVGRISHVVFMGMGEPMSNFENVTRAIRTLTAEWGLGISARRITVSTVGLPAQIRRLAEIDLPVTLALSLHAPNDELRRKLIPWAEYVTIEQLLDACRHYFNATGREITLEYILLREVNDRPEHAYELAHLARRLRANVNLIRYNEVRGLPFGRPDTDDVRGFQAILREAGVNTHIRASRGRDIAAACGQLRHEHASR